MTTKLSCFQLQSSGDADEPRGHTHQYRATQQSQQQSRASKLASKLPQATSRRSQPQVGVAALQPLPPISHPAEQPSSRQGDQHFGQAERRQRQQQLQQLVTAKMMTKISPEVRACDRPLDSATPDELPSGHCERVVGSARSSASVTTKSCCDNYQTPRVLLQSRCSARQQKAVSVSPQHIVGAQSENNAAAAGCALGSLAQGGVEFSHQKQQQQQQQVSPQMGRATSVMSLGHSCQRLQQQQQPPKQSPARWSSCWDGRSIDGELLYKTVRASRSLRLTSAALQQQQEQPPQRRLGEGQISLEKAQQRPQSSMNDPQTSDESTPKDSATELYGADPLSDPLYASVLGTSKQLQAIAVAEKARKQSQQQVAQSTGGLGAPTPVQRQDSLGSLGGGSCSSRSSSSANQLGTLVERCLEVRRAIRNNGSLLASSSGPFVTGEEDRNYSNFCAEKCLTATTPTLQAENLKAQVVELEVGREVAGDKHHHEPPISLLHNQHHLRHHHHPNQTQLNEQGQQNQNQQTAFYNA